VVLSRVRRNHTSTTSVVERASAARQSATPERHPAEAQQRDRQFTGDRDEGRQDRDLLLAARYGGAADRSPGQHEYG